MKDLQFPFPYREGQRDIVSGVYHTVSSGKTLFVQAPTGVGKTMSAIFLRCALSVRERGNTFLSYRKNHHRNCGAGGIPYPAGKRSEIQGNGDHGKGKTVFSGYSGMYTGEMSLCKGTF